ncbi:MAG: hypothetical protein JWP45_1155 [Mucilaginibacter sp.]|nr:hypothetical protein [Mucilaginibacter sp.]MDB5139624.1 hypothetical protein [Mucilaginibacter sp.]
MTLKDRVIKNIYTIENIIAGEIIISLKSKEIYKNAVKSSLTAEGAPSDLSFGLEKKEKSFEEA